MVVSAIRGAIQALENGNLPQEKVEEALKQLRIAAQGMDIYNLDRKRLAAALQREIKNLQPILEMAKAIPITEDEKTINRKEKKWK
jgi:Holliday junction resolvasome RuvABC ATP-dependent DNA helicase subunit